MELSFTLQIEAKKEKIWEYYANIKKWHLWEKDFITATKGVMKLKEMPPINFELTSVVENECFTNKTNTPMGSIHFSHEIFEKEGKVYIKHSTALKNKKASIENINFLSNIFKGVPAAMMLIKKLAEEK